MNNKDRILEYLRDATAKLKAGDMGAFKGDEFSASYISNITEIARPNVSKILNQLERDGELVKIKGKPVYYVHKKTFEKTLSHSFSKNIMTLEEFSSLMKKSIRQDDPFSELIGYDGSLKMQIEQAKAAILYPPYGLHTLIIGAPGTGKTRIAELMYNFSRSIDKHRGFVTFNCADYYNNPQLLMAYLFGYVKGSFTGADSDRDGIIENAAEGILFLDEVHRLPPEGQEMLFYLMDRGEYHRLGDTKIRQVNLMIIAATTEEPSSALLKTFLRRIPIVIKMPLLDERPTDEKEKIIKYFFKNEAQKFNMDIYIYPEAFKALLKHNYDGNVGELRSVIQTSCSKGLLKSYISKDVCLKIDFSVLPDFVNKSLGSDSKEYGIFNEIIKITNDNDNKNQEDDDFYDIIINEIDRLKNLGYDDNLLIKNVSKFIDGYFSSSINSFKKVPLNGFAEIVDKKIVDFTVEIREYAEKEIGKKLSDNFIYAFALHTHSLIERLKKSKYVVNEKLSEIKENYMVEYGIATKIAIKMTKQFKMHIPEDEIGYITILLVSNEVGNKGSDCVAVLVIEHGEHTASSMADVANKLLNIDKIKFFDMPLDMSVSDALSSVLQLCKDIDEGKGVLLLVDMGSLKDFGKSIENITGIKTRTIDGVNIQLILDAARKAYYEMDDLDTIYDSLRNNFADTQVKKKAIITVCSTGVGTAQKIKDYIESNYTDLSGIEIFPFDISQLTNNNGEYLKLKNDYEIILCAGSINPQLIDVPFISLEALMKDKNSIYKKLNRADIDQNDPYMDVKSIMEEFLTYINPHKFVKYYSLFVNELENELGRRMDTDMIIKLGTHMGCAIERIFTNNFIIYDKKQYTIDRHKKLFQIIKSAVKNIEKGFGISINDDEICFIIDILNSAIQIKTSV